MLDRANKQNLIQKVLEIQNREKIEHVRVDIEKFIENMDAIKLKYPEYENTERESLLELLLLAYVRNEDSEKVSYLQGLEVLTGEPSTGI